jgi:hypothetical protein
MIMGDTACKLLERVCKAAASFAFKRPPLPASQEIDQAQCSLKMPSKPGESWACDVSVDRVQFR